MTYNNNRRLFNDLKEDFHNYWVLFKFIQILYSGSFRQHK